MTLMTVSALPVDIMNIANIHVAKPCGTSDIVGFDQRLVAGPRAIGHPKIRMKCSKVNRHVRPDGIQQPIGQPLRLVRIIVGIRDDQIRQFHPTVGFVAYILDRVQHRLQMRTGQLVVKRFGKRLQVDVRCIHRAKELTACFGSNVASGDGDGLDILGVASRSRIDRVLRPDDRVVVRERDTSTSKFFGSIRDRFGAGVIT